MNAPLVADYSPQVERVRLAALRAWTPRPSDSVSELAAQHLYLSKEYSKSGGLVDLTSRPYLIEPMDRLGPEDPVQVVVFMGPIQGGKTVIGQAMLTAIICAFPGPTLWVTDTESKAELFSKKRFDLMVRDSPGLAARVADPKSRNKDNTVRRKTFRGGEVEFVGAQSASGLTSNTFQYVVIDEADDHKANVSYAGSSIALAMGRQTDYGDLAKTLIVSSPKNKGDSDIEAWHDRGDQREFQVPCPKCGEFQALQFRTRHPETGAWEYRLVWPKGKPEEARYLCAHCGAAIENRDKNWMLPRGRWIAARPDLGEGGTIASYHLNALYLPVGSYSWSALARQWDSAMARLQAGDHDEHRTVVNTRLAESYEVPGDSLDAHALQRLVEPDWPEDAIPSGVKVITIGTDVQRHTRLESIAIGWGSGWEAWVLDYAVIKGDPSSQEAWTEHDEWVRRVYRTADGRSLRAAAACVDRGDLAQKVLEYTGPRYKWGVYAVKGDDGRPTDAIWDKTLRWSDKNKKRKSSYYVVRTIAAKDEIKRMLGILKPGPFYLHVPERVIAANPDWLDQLCAERRTSVRDAKGRPQVKWDKVASHRRNEVLDTLVYALAGAHSLAMGGSKFHLGRRVEIAGEPIVQQAAAAQPPETSTTAPEPAPQAPVGEQGMRRTSRVQHPGAGKPASDPWNRADRASRGKGRRWL